jgi:hypothetical protein
MNRPRRIRSGTPVFSVCPPLMAGLLRCIATDAQAEPCKKIGTWIDNRTLSAYCDAHKAQLERALAAQEAF